MLPQVINPARPEDTALAPYNFVPLHDRLVAVAPETLPDQDRYQPDRYTGQIECVLGTETPTYIRSPLTPEEFARLEDEAEKAKPYDQRVKNKPDFFYTDPAKTPRIPGSSLRGMLRTLVEIASYGKFEQVTDQPLVYRAVGDVTSHGSNYRERLMHLDSEGYDERNKRYQAYTPLVRAGYLMKIDGEWRIQPAVKRGGVTFARIHLSLLNKLGPGKDYGLVAVPGSQHACYIYIQSGPWEYQMIRGGHIRIRYAKVLRADRQPGNGLIQGVLAPSGHMASKRHEAVIYPLDPQADPILIKDDLLLAYLDQVSPEQANLLGEQGLLTEANKKDAAERDKPVELAADGFPLRRQPVFYLWDEEQRALIFFGHTMMMRLPYPQSPKDLVPKELRDPARVDLADALFGYTKAAGRGKARGYASRLFVGDALLDPNQTNIWLTDQPLTPKILASPKPTAFQQYLVQEQPNPEEVGRTRDGRSKYQKALADYTAATPETSVLRGYKLYWHKDGAVDQAAISEPAEKLQQTHKEKSGFKLRDSQYTQVRPVRAGVNFRFTLRFENLASHELGALLWALTLPGGAGEEYRHKLGMGKPYGMGTVHIQPTALRLEDRTDRYHTLFGQSGTTWQWYSGERPLAAQEQMSDHIRAFEGYITGQVGRANGGLLDLPRLQVLFKLLAWPGPATDQTRYLEIEHAVPNARQGKRETVNEYKDRKVLPSPLATPSAPGRRVRATATRPQPVATPTRPTPQPETGGTLAAEVMRHLQGQAATTPIQAPAGHTLSQPGKKEEITAGMYLEGKVLRVEPERVVVDIGVDEATLVKDEIVPAPRDRADMEERFAVQSTVRAWVRRINQKGRVQLTLREPRP